MVQAYSIALCTSIITNKPMELPLKREEANQVQTFYIDIFLREPFYQSINIGIVCCLSLRHCLVS